MQPPRESEAARARVGEEHEEGVRAPGVARALVGADEQDGDADEREQEEHRGEDEVHGLRGRAR